MRRRIAQCLCLTVFCVALLCSVHTYAATPLDPAADASLTLHYQNNGNAFPDLSICIYRVAEAFPNGTFELIEPFTSYPVCIYDIALQEQWKNTAATLSAYIVADQILPDREERTNEAGTATFTHLETGLYLIREVVAENNTGTYVFNQFMVYLPSQQSDGSYNYSVEARPKCTNFVPKTEYRVTKLWQDDGSQAKRPEEITVEIYKDGQLQETQILSPDNNWSYTWYVSEEDQGKWTVTERSVPDDYTVTIQENGDCFSIINTHRSSQGTPDSPQTGDTFTPLPWILTMCISGIMLLILGIYRRRRV